MNDGLIDAFRHNAWATRELFQTLQPLTSEQLGTEVTGAYGSIQETLWHILSAEAGYSTRLTGVEQDWDRLEDPAPDLSRMAECAADVESRWEQFLSQPFDAERMLVVQWEKGEARDIPAGVILAQALHHSNEHRAQIASALTSIGIEPPEWGVWEYADASGRARPH